MTKKKPTFEFFVWSTIFLVLLLLLIIAIDKNIKENCSQNHHNWFVTWVSFKSFNNEFVPRYDTLDTAIKEHNNLIPETSIIKKDNYFLFIFDPGYRNAFIAFRDDCTIIPEKSGKFYIHTYFLGIIPYYKKVPPPSDLSADLSEYIEQF